MIITPGTLDRFLMATEGWKENFKSCDTLYMNSMDFEKQIIFFTKNVCIDEYLPCPGEVGSSSLLLVNFILACEIQRTVLWVE